MVILMTQFQKNALNAKTRTANFAILIYIIVQVADLEKDKHLFILKREIVLKIALKTIEFLQLILIYAKIVNRIVKHA